MSRRNWRSVEELQGLLRLDRVEFRLPPDAARRARRILMSEAAQGRVISAEERPSRFRVRGRKGYHTLAAVVFRVTAPREQSPELQIRLADELGCSVQNPHFYLRDRELR